MTNRDLAEKIYEDLNGVKNCSIPDVVVSQGTLCVVCEKRKAGYGYDLHFCKECWEEKA